MIDFLRAWLDYLVFGILGLMSFLMLWFAFERLIYYWRLRLSEFDHPEMLNVALTRNLTWISTIGSNAPYVGLLGTVFGILITFYDIGQSSNIEPAAIMTGLALALKATALGLPLPAVAGGLGLDFFSPSRRKAGQVSHLHHHALVFFQYHRSCD